MAEHTDGDAPVVLRFGLPDAAAVAAATWVPTEARRLQSALLRRIAQTRLDRAIWIAGYPPLRPFPWAERAIGLADYGWTHGYWGHLPPSYGAATPAAPAAPPWDPECPVCLDDYTDLFPTPDAHSRAPPRRWACLHAVCRRCDVICQNGQNDKCPLCRAQRRVTMLP